MSLNEYRDEAKRFMRKIKTEDDKNKLISMLEEEFDILKATDVDDENKLRHQVYDMMFLLFEMAAKFDMDLDREWEKGRRKKEAKYAENGGAY